MSTNSTFETMLSILNALSFCCKIPSTQYHMTVYVLVNVPLVLPLCVYILRLGVQRWRAGAKISHNDFFTFNMVSIQIICVFSSSLLFLNNFVHNELMVLISVYLFLITCSTVVFFQTFTCLECYLAVVHPVTYLGLKSQTWTLIRNVSCEFVWLQCVAQSIYFSKISGHVQYICTSLTFLSLFVVLVLFCCLSVLRELLRPAPGDGVKKNKSKRRAFYTVTAITATLLLKFAGEVASVSSFAFATSMEKSCTLWSVTTWLSLPSVLVLPALFLQRNGKLLRAKRSK